MLASGDMNGVIFLWNTSSGKCLLTNQDGIQAHSKWITSISWEPFHMNVKCDRFATAGKDRCIRIWNTRTQKVVFSLSGHTDTIQSIKWGGQGYLYSGSRDRTVRVWDVNQGTCVRILSKHAHWVNHIAISTAHALKTGWYFIFCHTILEGKLCGDIDFFLVIRKIASLFQRANKHAVSKKGCSLLEYVVIQVLISSIFEYEDCISLT